MKLIGLIGALGLGAASAAAVAACGSSNASHASLPTVTITTPAPTTTTQPTSTATAPTTTTTLPTVTSPPAQTRTATGPAFTQTTGGTSSPSGDLQAAVAKLKVRGYAPVSTASYDPNQTLRVLIGRNGGAEQAFFFDGTTFLGTDTKDPSRSISVTSQTDTGVTLRYSTTNGPATVHFELDMGKLTPLDTIPSSTSRLG